MNRFELEPDCLLISSWRLCKTGTLLIIAVVIGLRTSASANPTETGNASQTSASSERSSLTAPVISGIWVATDESSDADDNMSTNDRPAMHVVFNDDRFFVFRDGYLVHSGRFGLHPIDPFATAGPRDGGVAGPKTSNAKEVDDSNWQRRIIIHTKCHSKKRPHHIAGFLTMSIGGEATLMLNPYDAAIVDHANRKQFDWSVEMKGPIGISGSAPTEDADLSSQKGETDKRPGTSTSALQRVRRTCVRLIHQPFEQSTREYNSVQRRNLAEPPTILANPSSRN